MRHDFTPAALRAIDTACAGKRGDDELRGPELLLGLLAEDECRAAALLVRHGLDVAEVQRRWPELAAWPPLDGKDRGNGRAAGELIDGGKAHWSAELQAGLAEASQMLARHPQPISWSTEHLLLAVAAADGTAARWLEERGLAVKTIVQELEAIAGIDDDATPLEWNDDFRVDDSLRELSRQLAEGVAHTEEAAACRILDAAANRCREGLRVVEDFARFALDDAFLTSELKRLRHDLAVCLARLPAEWLIAFRDTPGDVGTSIATASEARRDDAAHVAVVNFKRAQESLRSLEEYGKLLDAGFSAAIEQLRYRGYTLERAVMNTARNTEQLAHAQLYALIDGRKSVEEFERLAAELVAASVHLIQLRDKALSDRELLDRARRLRRLTAGSATLFIMNDRPDLAALAEADGVHVGQDELSVQDCRRIVGHHRLVGVSTHSIEQARRAVIDAADYLGVGPVFEGLTKHFSQLPGLDLVRQVAAEIRLPAFAIGGITFENLEQVRAAGLHRVAVRGALLSGPQPGQTAAALLRQLALPVAAEE